MDIRRILVPVSGRYSPNDRENLDLPAIAAGMKAARQFEARVDVVSVTETERTAEPEWKSWLPGRSIDPLFKEIERLGRVRRKQARAAFDASLKGQSDRVRAEFTEAEGSIPDVVGTFGRLSDLIVLANSEARWAMPKRPIMETVLWQTGRPALVVPQSVEFGRLKSIQLAWNSSATSARALQAALPVLQLPDVDVTVVTCAERGQGTNLNAAPVCGYLEEHGVYAWWRQLNKSGHRKAANAIADFAKEEGCQLLVLGSVSHIRAHSIVFGSLTDRVLSQPETPVLLCP